MPTASSLAALIKKKFNMEPLLIEGANGVFEVTVDGDLIFSKKKEGRFPEDEEILGPLAERA